MSEQDNETSGSNPKICLQGRFFWVKALCWPDSVGSRASSYTHFLSYSSLFRAVIYIDCLALNSSLETPILQFALITQGYQLTYIGSPGLQLICRDFPVLQLVNRDSLDLQLVYRNPLAFSTALGVSSRIYRLSGSLPRLQSHPGLQLAYRVSMAFSSAIVP